VIEALRVQRSGFPCRQPAEECWKDLRILLTLSQKKALDPKPLNERLKDALKALSESLQWPKDKDGKYEIGKTRVFFKQPAYEVLEGARLDVQAKAVVKLQAMVRMAQMYQTYKAIRASFLFLQNTMRRAIKLKKAREVCNLPPPVKKEPPKPKVDVDVEAKKKIEEANKKMEEDARLKREAEEQALKLKVELQKQKDEQDRVHAELEAKANDAENKMRQMAAKLAEFERSNQQYKNDYEALQQSSSQEINEANDRAQKQVVDAADKLEQNRGDMSKEMEDMQKRLEESYEKQLSAVSKRAEESAASAKKQIEASNASAKEWQDRFEAETVELRTHFEQQQKKWQGSLREAEGSGKTANVEKVMLEDQLLQIKGEATRNEDRMKRENDNLKRMHETQLDTLRTDFEDREGSFNKELEGLRGQREQASKAFSEHLERQREDLARGRDHELEFLKKRHEDELAQSKRMVDRVRIEQCEKEKTWESQLQLKDQQVQDLERAHQMKTQHLVDSSKRQRELHEAQVEQVSRQLRETQETFRRQLDEARAAAPPKQDGRGARNRLSAQPKVKARLSVARMSSALGPGKKMSTTSKIEDGPAKEFLQMSLSNQGQPRDGDVRVWKELNVEKAICVIAFANATFDVDHELLALGQQDGLLSMFKIPKTRLERGEGLEMDDMGSDPQLTMRFPAHKKAITSMCFHKGGEEFITTSADWTVKVWNTKDGALLNELLDSALVISVVPIPGPNRTMVTANANAVLRFVVGNSMVQKVRLEHYSRSLEVGLDGKRVLSGSTKGFLDAFSVGPDGLTNEANMQISKVAVMCIKIVNCKDGGPLVIANCMESQVLILQANPMLTSFTILRRMTNDHKVLPLKGEHLWAPGRTGYYVSGSEDSSVYVYDLDTFEEFKLSKAHLAPVMAATASQGGTLMASADVKGHVCLWRRGAGSGK